MSEPELEITIDATVFEAAVERFKASCVSLLYDHVDTLAAMFRGRLLASICAQVEGRPVRITIKTEEDAPRRQVPSWSEREKEVAKNLMVALAEELARLDSGKETCTELAHYGLMHDALAHLIRVNAPRQPGSAGVDHV